MLESTQPTVMSRLELYSKPTLVKGTPINMRCVEIDGQTLSLTKSGPITLISLEEEWYENLRDPYEVIEKLRSSRGFKPDIFTFWQRLPDIEPRYSFHLEWEELAVLKVTSYDHWWNHQIKPRIRNLIRKAEKEGVEVRETVYDDTFVRGMVAIFNEAAVRQGRRFWHYGKDFETVKHQFSRFLSREQMIGAYYRDELIGFVMLGDASQYGVPGQIISSIKHRDKATNNALIAKSVAVCEKRQLPYLVYFYWSDDSLSEFKRRCGFEKTRVPRYFVPITQTGKLALRLGLHRGWKAAMPHRIKHSLKRIRSSWYNWQARYLARPAQCSDATDLVT